MIKVPATLATPQLIAYIDTSTQTYIHTYGMNTTNIIPDPFLLTLKNPFFLVFFFYLGSFSFWYFSIVVVIIVY